MLLFSSYAEDFQNTLSSIESKEKRAASLLLQVETALFKMVVPRTRLELVRITPHAPQTCAATNYATSADD